MKLLRFLLVSVSIFLTTPAFATCDTDGPATCAIVGASSSATVSPAAFTVTSTPSCQVVTNSGGVAIMVPMFSEAAWSSFLNNLQSGVTVSSCGCSGTPWGTVANGASVTAYAASSVGCGGSCSSQTRTCSNGSLSGSYGNTSCSVNACSGCSLPWGGSINHGDSVTAYAASSVACGSSCTSESETRSCNNGSLSGSYGNSSCAVGTCTASCTITYDGSAQTVASGTTITRYTTSSATASDPCSCGGAAEAATACNKRAQSATCTNGTVSGTNPITATYSSCTGSCTKLCTGCNCP